MRVLVAGGGGFIGSWLCERLLGSGEQVISVDNYSTSTRAHVRELEREAGFLALRHDICSPFEPPDPLDVIVNLAVPTTPSDCQRLALDTLRAAAAGTENLLRMAETTGARFVQATVVEVPEPAQDDVGDAEPTADAPPSPTTVLLAARRFAETLVQSYHHERGVRVAWVRLHHAYGPRMRSDDGRLVTRLCTQALRGEAMRIPGDGSQPTGFCYVADLVDGLVAALRCEHPGPFDLGDPEATSTLAAAEQLAALTRGTVQPDPALHPAQARQPDLDRARDMLGWQPRTSLEEGLRRTLDHLRASMPG